MRGERSVDEARTTAITSDDESSLISSSSISGVYCDWFMMKTAISNWSTVGRRVR